MAIDDVVEEKKVEVGLYEESPAIGTPFDASITAVVCNALRRADEGSDDLSGT